jgi:hypothetical protein
VSQPTAITPAILDTILGHLAAHFLASANYDLPTARHAAGHVLAACGAETADELRLAAEIISFGFHALRALGEAVSPDVAAPERHRLRGTAVSLSRESHKSQRKLDQLRRVRMAASKPPEAPEPEDQRLYLIECAKDAYGAVAWPAAPQQRRAGEGIAEKPRREARQTVRAAARTTSQTGAA